MRQHGRTLLALAVLGSSEPLFAARLQLAVYGQQPVPAPPQWLVPHANLAAIALSALALLLLLQIGRWLYQRGCRRAVLAERERLQLDLHDTLAQSFAGIGFQLRAIRRAIPRDLGDLERHVDLAHDLLLHSRKEALRTFSAHTREGNDRLDLLRALETSARTMAEGGTLAITASIAGEQRRLGSGKAFALLRIGQEAIANSIRHAHATHLAIALCYDEIGVTLSVSDNGTGFIDRGDLLGFGLRGMRQRAAAVSATIEVSSTPGAGTLVSVAVPSQPAFRLSLIRNTLRHYWEPPIHAHSEE